MTFSFAEPGFLRALPLAGLPLLLHLLSLRSARRVPFSDLSLLRAVQARALPRLRLRQRAVLALRCLALALLVLAFSRPVLHSGPAGTAAGPREGLRLVLLVDVSWSMGYRAGGATRLEAARAAGEALARLLRPQDRVAVGAFSDRLEGGGRLEWAGSPGEAVAFLRRLEPGWRDTDFLPALRAAYELLGRSPGGRKAVVVLSDGAAHGWRGRPESLAGLPGFDPSAALLGLEWPDAPENACVLSASPAELASGPGLSASLILSAGPQTRPRPGWTLDLRERSSRTAQKALRLEPGREARAEFALPPGRENEAWGSLETRADALPADDAFYYSLRSQPPPRVLLIHGGDRSLVAGRGAYFLRKLLAEPQGRLLPYRLETADALRWRSLRLQDYAAVLLADFESVGAELGAALERYARAGGGLWIFPAASRDPEAYRPLSNLLPAALGLLSSIPAAGLAAEPSVGGSGPAWSEFELRNIQLRRSYALEPKAGAEIWFKDGAGRPALLSWSQGAGRVLLSAFALDLDWTNLGIKPLFSAWMDAGLRRLTGFEGRAEWRAATVGGKVARVWGPQEAAPAAVLVRGPQGRQASLRVSGRRVEYEPQAPGLYFLEAPGAPAEFYAVNLDRSSGEWDPRPARSPPWRPLRPDAPERGFLDALYGRPLRGPALALLLALLALESLLANPRRAGSAILLFLLLPLGARSARAQEGDRFVWTQLRHEGDWDPYPGAHAEAMRFLAEATSVAEAPARRVIGLKDAALFSSPFAFLEGRRAPAPLDEEEARRLRDYLVAGGFLWIDDASGLRSSSFDRWTRGVLARLFPDAALKPLGPGHVIYKTFFLLRRAGGRVLLSEALEGVEWGGRLAVVYSRNDLLGALAKDALGRPLFDCAPGGEAQRAGARKTALNILMYALTGNYKADAVHQPFLLEKMRSEAP